MQETSNIKAIAEAHLDRVWGLRDFSAIDDLFDSNVTLHNPFGNYYGTKALHVVVRSWIGGLPDLVLTVQSMIAEGDRVVVQWHIKGTHTGMFQGILGTGKKVSYDGVSVYRIVDDKVLEYWVHLDVNHLVNQLNS
ncbi:MAG: ester cyclase [Chlamydiales bacterium]|nr:ester cyclase [Chlamydiales bacterium]